MVGGLARWKSYSAPEKTILMTNVQDSVFQLFQRVENKHGWMLVRPSHIPLLQVGEPRPRLRDRLKERGFGA